MCHRQHGLIETIAGHAQAYIPGMCYRNLAGAQLSVDKPIRLALARALLLIAVGAVHAASGPLSVEQMLPSSTPKEWLQQPGFTLEEAHMWKHTLGNLFLVPGKVPCPLSSRSYKDKQEVGVC